MARIFKSQSVLEYLVTYAWAILIIVVVAGVIFYVARTGLGSSGAAAQPGECQVTRLSPGSTQGLGLVGQCGGLLPFTVQDFDGTSYDEVNNPYNTLNIGNNFTLTFWIDPQYAYQADYAGVWVDSQGVGSGQSALIYTSVNPAGAFTTNAFVFKYIDTSGVTHDNLNTGNKVKPGRFSFLAMTFNTLGGVGQGTLKWYVNGTLTETYTSENAVYGTNNIYIGVTTAATQPFNGLISNFQFYNVALNANEVERLYTGGIGGAPVNLENLVGWWPLNQNVNDYSGNGQNGNTVKGNTIYPTDWQALSGYTQT